MVIQAFKWTPLRSGWIARSYDRMFRPFSKLRDLHALRCYRDQVLTRKPVGAKLVRRLYGYSSEISRMLLEDDDLANRVKRVIAQNMEGVRRALRGRAMVLRDAEEVDRILANAGKRASPGLRELILDVRRELRGNRTAEEFGFRVDRRLVKLTEESREGLPQTYVLFPCRPNPFNPITTMAYDLPEASDVTLTIYTVIGQHVATVVSGHQDAGHYEVVWDADGLANGVYFCRLEAGPCIQIRKMTKIE